MSRRKAEGLHTPCFEPDLRVKCLEHVPRGMRQFPEAPRWIRHRFEIRGGVTAKHALRFGIEYGSALLSRLRHKSNC